MITWICAIIGALCAVGGLLWKLLRKKEQSHEAIEAAVDPAQYDELDRFNRL